MSDLVYYRDEVLRHPAIEGVKCSRIEAEIALPKLFRHFGVRHIPTIRFTSGARISRAGRHGMTLNVDSMTWLLLAHEFAHTWDANRRLAWRLKNLRAGVEVFIPREFRSSRRWHDKYHARLVDRVVAYIVAKQWTSAVLLHQHVEKMNARHHREKLAARPPSVEQRIAHKYALILALERRIGRLQTQMRKHRRSISAIGAAARSMAIRVKP